MSVTLTTTISSSPLLSSSAKLLKPVNQKSNTNQQNNKSSSSSLLDSAASQEREKLASNEQPQSLAQGAEKQQQVNSKLLQTNNNKNDYSATNGNSNGVALKQQQQQQQTRLITDDDIINTIDASQEDVDKDFKPQLVWTNIILFIILHTCIPLGAYVIYTQRPWKTSAFAMLLVYLSGLGVTGGTHRLWSHKSYKASLPVQLILIVLQTCAGQNSAYTWSRDHRVHHKFAETNADPHNIKRGFFFAHMGWLCCKKHPEVARRGALIDMSDLAANPIVAFQHRHFWWMSALFTVLVPTMIPVLLWQERFWTSFLLSFMLRYTITLHGTWLVNSAAHYYGDRPYDERIEARESPFVIASGLGEGFHNYHHTFPYDYSTSEYGKYFNITTAFIDAMAAIGWVHDRRSASNESIAQRRLRTGDKLGKKQLQESIKLRGERTALGAIIQDMPYVSGLTSMKFSM